MKLKIGKIIFILVLVLSWISMDCYADPGERPDNKEIITLYLFNFLLFVDWPEDASSDRNTITLIIHGDLRLYEAMKSLEGKTIKGKKLVVYSQTEVKDIRDSCRVLFIGSSEKASLQELLQKVHGKSILTVSDMEGFLHLGGMVRFVEEKHFPSEVENQKRFKINLSAVERSGLKIRSRLLRISDIVYDAEPESLQ